MQLKDLSTHWSRMCEYLQLTTVALEVQTAPPSSSAQVVDMLHFLTRHNLACIETLIWEIWKVGRW